MPTLTRHIEVPMEFEVNIEPFRRGRYTGPPEHCYPDEGGTAEIVKALVATDTETLTLWRRDLVEILDEDTVSEFEVDLYEQWDDEDHRY